MSDAEALDQLTDREKAWVAMSSGVPLTRWSNLTDFETSRLLDAISRLAAHEADR